MKSTSTLLGLTIFYAVVFLFSALEPSSRAVWFAEIVPAIGILIAIWALSIRYQFSNTAYVLMFIWLCFIPLVPNTPLQKFRLIGSTT